MKSQTLISTVLTLALEPLVGSFAALAATDTPPAPAAPAASAATPQLSPPARGVAKMLASGVSEEVVKAYIQNAPSTFSLNAEDIIRLQEMGVSGNLTAEMLKHDKTLRESAGVSALPPSAPPVQPPVAPGAVTPPLVSDYDVYDNLAPYGYWYDWPGYGWCWQPYSWLGYNAYPWAWLGFGYWWNSPGRGWCWRPHSQFRGFDRSHVFRSSFAVNHFGGSRFSTFQSHARSFTTMPATHSVINANRGTVAVRSSAWAPTFSGGFHGSVGGGFHGGGSFHSGGGSFHGGGGGGFHGGGGGGFHGGGGHGGGHR